jgi:hypothetical protein
MPSRRWTPPRLFRLAGELERGHADAAIAAALGTTVAAVKVARCRYGIPSRTACSFSAISVARLLGVPHERVRWWLRDGFLAGRLAGPRGPNRQWRIDEAAVWAFCEDPRYWGLWDPHAIPDPALRDWAVGVRDDRAGERWLTPEEAAPRFCVEAKTLRRWLAEGRLPAIKCSRFWFVDPTAVPPVAGPSAG